MREKTRKVNVVMYQDEQWKVALNLPEVPLSTHIFSPAETRGLGAALRGVIPARRLSHRLREIYSYVKRNVADDLITETANQLENMGNLAEYSQLMADNFVQRLQTKHNEYLMSGGFSRWHSRKL